MFNKKYYSLLILIIFTIFSCQKEQSIDVEAIEQEILEIHNLSRKYHVEKMAEEFISQLSDNHISVNRGKISKLNKEKKKQHVFKNILILSNLKNGMTSTHQ